MISYNTKGFSRYDSILISEVLKILMEMNSELCMTFDQQNTTALHTASEQGHLDVVNYLLEKNSSMANIARSNLKTALHSCARKGHLEVVKALTQKVPGIVARADKKGQTALHMAVKGQNVEVVDALIEADNGLINIVDKKNNTALHITSRKGRTQVFKHVHYFMLTFKLKRITFLIQMEFCYTSKKLSLISNCYYSTNFLLIYVFYVLLHVYLLPSLWFIDGY